ncbi:MAG: autotransporter assembly complex protein TamA [Rhodocyclaceae bacterium]|nr:autotransporter assembly complex protein TamA [Rhodocyclaceae bacterium]
MLALAGCALACAALPLHAAYRVEIEAPATLRQLLADNLDLSRYRDREDIDAEQVDFMLATAADDVARLAATEGYFSPRTTVSVAGEAPNRLIRLVVDPGERTRISRVDVKVEGSAAAQAPAQVAMVRGSWSLRPGEPFRKEAWDAAKQAGLDVLRRDRYAAARIVASQARIHADDHRADLAVAYDSGPPFTLGALQVSGDLRYPEAIVRNVDPLHPGEAYSRARLLEFQRQILRTPYYSNAVVDIDPDPARTQLTPVNVQLTENPVQRIRTGIGYSTDVGAHIDGRYSHYDVFDQAWVLDAQAKLEQRRQSGAVSLSLPPDASAAVDSVHASTERSTLEGIDLSGRRVGVRRARQSDTRDIAFALEYYRDTLEQANGATPPPDTVVQPGTHRALVAGIEYTGRRVDSLTFPRQGRIYTVEAGAAVRGALTDQTFTRVYLRLHEYLPVGRRDVAILRGELGAVATAGGNAAVPASLLFRAGGGESVRGYRYQSIGNLSNGTVYPARTLATASAEYQHWLNESWGGAVFYDLGKAADTWNQGEIFRAIGVGVRWRSPAGTISGDLGYGLADRKIRPSFSLGISF